MRFVSDQSSEKFPLAGVRILVTRQDTSESSLSGMLESKGASVISVPMTQIGPPTSWESFDEKVLQATNFDWAVFTSRKGVTHCLSRLKELELSPKNVFSTLKIACVGKATASAVAENGLVAELVPDHFQSEGLISAFSKYDLNQKYKILIAVDDSPNTRKAVKYGTRVSQAFNVPVEMITVSKKDEFGDGYTNAANWAKKFLRRSNISFGHQYLVGDPVQVIYEVAGDNHIIVMGSSTQNPLLKFFKGSKPLNVMETCKCPILIVK